MFPQRGNTAHLCYYYINYAILRTNSLSLQLLHIYLLRRYCHMIIHALRAVASPVKGLRVSASTCKPHLQPNTDPSLTLDVAQLCYSAIIRRHSISYTRRGALRVTPPDSILTLGNVPFGIFLPRSLLPISWASPESTGGSTWLGSWTPTFYPMISRANRSPYPARKDNYSIFFVITARKLVAIHRAVKTNEPLGMQVCRGEHGHGQISPSPSA